MAGLGREDSSRRSQNKQWHAAARARRQDAHRAGATLPAGSVPPLLEYGQVWPFLYTAGGTFLIWQVPSDSAPWDRLHVWLVT